MCKLAHYGPIEPRRGLAKTDPDKAEYRRRVCEWFREFCGQHGISQRVLCDWMRCSKSTVHSIFECRRSIHEEDFIHAPDGWYFRIKHELECLKHKLREERLARKAG